jgi:ATP-dependent Clp protease ATP-binding subunit ClpC
MAATNQNLQFLICTSCNGLGRINGRKCKICAGQGIVSYLEGYVLYWSKKINARYLRLYKLEKLLSLLVFVCLLTIAILGLASLLYALYLVDYIGALDAFFWLNGTNFYLFFFWLTVLADMYLIYFTSLAKDKREAIMVRKYRSDEEALAIPPMPIDWQQVESFSNKYKVDISKAFSEEAMKVIEKSFEVANKYKALEVGPIHYLIAALLNSSSMENVMFRLGIDLTDLADKLGRTAAKYPQSEGQTVFSSRSKKILFKAYRLAYLHRLMEVDTADVVFEAVKADKMIQEVFFDLDINLEKLENVIAWQRIRRLLNLQWQQYRSSSRLKSKTGIDRAMTALQTAYLNQFSEDLTLAAKMGYLPLCIDRDKEFEEIFRVLEGSSVKGIILVGESGVGKTAMIEGLAQKMIADDVPEYLQDKRLVSLSISRLVSGASASAAQERLLTCLNELIIAGNVVLYIDNIHELMGISSGGAESLDLSDVIVEALSKNLLILIASSNSISYRNVIENTALGNITKKVEINEPDTNGAIQIISGKIGAIEAKDRVYFTYNAIEQAVKLTGRFIHDQYMPYKALTLLEEVGVWARKKKGQDTLVTGNDVAELFSGKIGMPVAEITESESQKLLRLEDEIHKKIIDQEEAVKAVADSLRRARAELRDIKRPIANLLFLGPTGVGKTELAKTIAAIYFGSEDNMIRLDMSEYQEKDSINRLIGAPPGYDGAGTGGQLTEAVRQKPFAIVLLDELEKAHPDILNLFLQVMEDGRLTDATGRTIDFTNVILIATSNAQTSFIQQKVQEGLPVEDIKKQLLETELKQYFKPEFINRFDSIIVFKPLTYEHVLEITRLMLKAVARSLEAKGVNFQATEEAITELAQVGYDPQYGARPLRRAIQEKVDNALAQHLLTGRIDRRDLVILEPGGVIRIEKSKKF